MARPTRSPTTPPTTSPRRMTRSAGSARRTKIPPSVRYPPAASPHVWRRSDPLRFTAAHGPIFSKISTGTTRYVTMPQAAPAIPAMMRPMNPNRCAIARRTRPTVAVRRAHPRIRRRDDEEQRHEEDRPDPNRDQQGNEREQDETLFLPQDAEADLRELPADREPLEEAGLPCGRVRRTGRDGGSGRPHGDRPCVHGQTTSTHRRGPLQDGRSTSATRRVLGRRRSP